MLSSSDDILTVGKEILLLNLSLSHPDGLVLGKSQNLILAVHALADPF